MIVCGVVLIRTSPSGSLLSSARRGVLETLATQPLPVPLPFSKTKVTFPSRLLDRMTFVAMSCG